MHFNPYSLFDESMLSGDRALIHELLSIYSVSALMLVSLVSWFVDLHVGIKEVRVGLKLG